MVDIRPAFADIPKKNAPFAPLFFAADVFRTYEERTKPTRKRLRRKDNQPVFSDKNNNMHRIIEAKCEIRNTMSTYSITRYFAFGSGLLDVTESNGTVLPQPTLFNYSTFKNRQTQSCASRCVHPFSKHHGTTSQSFIELDIIVRRNYAKQIGQN